MSDYKRTGVFHRKIKAGKKLTYKKKRKIVSQNSEDQVMAYTDNETRREHHNMLERQRRDKIKHCFTGLRDALPPIRGSNTNRIKILKTAIDFINEKSTTVRNHELEISAIEQENNRLEESIRELEALQAGYQSKNKRNGVSKSADRKSSFTSSKRPLNDEQHPLRLKGDFKQEKIDPDDIRDDALDFTKFFSNIKEESFDFDDDVEHDDIQLKIEYDSEDDSSSNSYGDMTNSSLSYNNVKGGKIEQDNRKKKLLVIKPTRTNFNGINEDDSTPYYDESLPTKNNVKRGTFQLEFDWTA